MSDLFAPYEFREYLVAQGIVRRFGDADNGLPQCLVDPRDGTPDPTAQNYSGAMVSIAKTNTVPSRPMEEFLQKQIIETIVRAYKSEDAQLIQRRLQDAVEGKELFVVGSLTVEQVQMFSGDQPLGSDKFGYTRMQTFCFWVRKRSLAGTPYYP